MPGTKLKLTKKQKKEFKKSFSKFDKNGDGKITIDELGAVFRDMHHEISDAVLAKYMKDVDTDGNGSLNFQEFVEMIAVTRPKTIEEETSDEIKEMFKEFDDNGDGHITRPELIKAMTKYGNFSDAEIDEMIKEADTDNDGRVNFKEFTKMMSK